MNQLKVPFYLLEQDFTCKKKKCCKKFKKKGVFCKKCPKISGID